MNEHFAKRGKKIVGKCKFSMPFNLFHSRSCLSAHLLFNLLNELGEKIRCEAVLSILSISSEFNKFNNTGARMQDSILYHTTLKSHLIRDFRIKTSRFCLKKMRRFLDVNT